MTFNFDNAKFDIKITSQFKNNYKKIKKQGKSLEELKKVVNLLAIGKELDQIYNNHKLENNKYYQNCWECHLGNKRSDWLLIYKYENNKILLLFATGSHSELFNK